MLARLQVTSAYRHLPAQGPSVNYGLLRIVPDVETGARLPVQIALVTDVSGSMHGRIGGPSKQRQRKLELAQEAALEVVNLLQDGDVFCLIAFSSKAKVVAPAQVLSADREPLRTLIGSLSSGSGTNMSSGIEAAQQQFAALPAGQAARRIVVLTDGETSGEKQCRQLAEQSSIPLLLGGIGNGYNARLLEEMARSSNGMAEYIDRAEAVSSFFRDAVVTAQATVLTSAVLRLAFRQHFRPRRIHQVSPELRSYDFTPITATNRQTEVALGDIQRDSMTLLIEYAYDGGAVPTEFQVAGLSLRYDQGTSTGLEVHSDEFAVLLAAQAGFPPIDSQVKAAIDRASVETAQRQLLQAAQAGDVALATQKLSMLQQGLERVGSDPAFVEQTVGTMRLHIKSAQAAESLAETEAAKRLASATRRLTLPS